MRQKIKKHRVAIGIVATVLAVIVALIIIGYQFDWTGFGGYNKVTTTHIISGTNAGTVTKTEEYQPGKGLWDWLQLFGILAIPVVAGVGAAWYTQVQQQRDKRLEQAQRDRDRQLADQQAESERKAAEQQAKTEREITQDNQREAALQEYIDKMSELLLQDRLGEEVGKIARVRTLTILSRLDASRKGSVLQFLYESGLIEKGKSIVDLSAADLSSANLVAFNLSGADLSEVNLREANLSYANLSGTDLHLATLTAANLFKANLNGANLEKAFLDGGADLSFADLSGANLQGAILKGTNLLGTKVASEQLDEATFFEGVTMPDGSIHP